MHEIILIDMVFYVHVKRVNAVYSKENIEHYKQNVKRYAIYKVQHNCF